MILACALDSAFLLGPFGGIFYTLWRKVTGAKIVVKIIKKWTAFYK